MMTSMLQMAYNLTDMAWIGRLGSNAVTAVGSAGMYLWLSSGIVTLARMGGQVKVAHSLGGNNRKGAIVFAQTALQMTIFLSVLVSLISILFTEEMIGFFKLQNSDTIHDAQAYLRIVCGFIIFSFLNQTLTGLFTAIGDSKTPLIANFIGLGVNMVLDPLLIFGIGSISGFGASGAAIATVVAQCVVTLVFIVRATKETILFQKISVFQKINFDYMKQIFALGLPSSAQNMVYCGISMIVTRFIANWGDAAIAIQRVGSQIECISWMTAEGFGSAINAFTGQNYGAKKYDRVKKSYFSSLGIMGIWGLFTSVVMISGASFLFEIFLKDPLIVPGGVDYLVILGYSQFFMCMELMTVGALQGMGKTMSTSGISMSLTAIRIPLALLLGATMLGLNGIWWAITISTTIKGIVFVIYYLITLKRLESV